MRPKTEWLILPLFVLPLLLGLAFHLWASAAHERDLDVYRRHGAEQVIRLTAPGGAAADYVENWEAPGSLGGHPGAYVPVRIGTTTLRAWAWKFSDTRPWTFDTVLPEGLAASALTDKAIRVKLETGTPPIDLLGPDHVARTFRKLLERPDLDALRQAVLPPATKRYIVERWIGRGGITWPLRAALDFMRATEDVAVDLSFMQIPGWHVVGTTDVEVPSSGRPVTFSTIGVGKAPRRVVSDPIDPSITLWFSKNWSDDYLFAGTGQVERVLWHRRLDAPLSGHWFFTYRGGKHWWQAQRFQVWIGPGLGVLLLLLGIPTALWFALRKRRKLDEARTRFINELAHDLRTPLTSLRLHAEMLGSGRTPEDRRPHYLGLIERESSRLTTLLTNLLDLSRLEGTTAKMHPESIEVRAAVGQAVNVFRAVHPDRAKDIRTEGDADTTVRADAAALARVLGNLLENTGKFTEPGTAVRIQWERADGGVVLTVADDGPGIPKAERATIFDRYARGRRAQDDGVSGSGLGLALVQELTTRMDGSIKLRASETGATFQIRLPEGDHA